jgi:hypothetical protein
VTRAALVVVALVIAACVPAYGSSAGGAEGFDGFWSPTRNLHCFGSFNGPRADLRCEVYKHDWAAPAGSCGPRRTAIFAMSGTGKPSPFCPNDSVPQHRTLRYGGTWKLGPFTCTMRRSGVTCKNARGRGWFLSRQQYQLYR